LGDSGTYLQHYVVTRAVLDTVATAATIGAEHLKYGDDFGVRSFVLPGVFTGTVVYVGSGLVFPKRGIDPYAGLDIRGKWLLVQGGFLGASGDSLGVRGVDYRTAGDEARSRGALGILSFAPAGAARDIPGSRGVPVRAPQELTPTVGRSSAPYPIPLILLTPTGLERLVRGERVSIATMRAADSTGHYPPSFELGAARQLKLELAAATSTIRPSNILALVEGSDPKLKDEWITVSTHLDGAVGQVPTPPGGDSIFNAADDNGSGSAANMAIARALMKGPRPRRSILLVWDSGEETGLWGSRFFAFSALARKVVAHFTVDMIARSKAPGTNVKGEEELTPPGVVYVSGPRILSTQLDAVLDRVSRDYGFITFDRRYEDPNHEFFYPRTDAAPYIENGIPYAEFFTGLHGDYHRQSDEVGKLDPVKFQAVARAVYAALWTASDDRVRPRMDKPLPPVLWFVTPK